MFRRIAIGAEHDLGMPWPAVEMFRVRNRDRTVRTMARHRRTKQLLAAVDGLRWGMWIAAPGDAPRDPFWIELGGEEALLLEEGVWHHGPIPLDRGDGAYLTVEAPHTNADDFEEKEVERAEPAARDPVH